MSRISCTSAHRLHHRSARKLACAKKRFINTSGTNSASTITACANGTQKNSGCSGGLSIDLRGKRAFIAGVADDKGFGWAIAKALSNAGADVILGTWVSSLLLGI